MDDWEDDLLALAEAPVVKKKKDKKKKRKRESSGSDMELGGSGSDMDLQGSSEDEANGNDEDEDEARPEMYPLEGIYKDTQDRAHLMAMTEIDRETILEERSQKLSKYQDRQLLKQMVAEQDGGASSDEDSRPRTRRQAPKSKRAKQLEELKQKRDSKKDRLEKRAKKRAEQGSDYDSDAENKARRSPSVPIYTDSEEEQETRANDDARPAAKKKGKSRDPAKLEDLIKICLPRSQLAQFWPCPWFPEYVAGAFVRMGVGQENGQPIYRLAKIEKVSENKSSRLYKLEKNVTDTKLTLVIGDDKKDMTMEMVSNSPPTEREFNRYIAILQQKQADVPTLKTVEDKLQNLQKFKDAVLTEADINLILTKKREQAKGDFHDRHTLRNERDIAMRSGDAEEVARIDRLLSEMDGGKATAAGVSSSNGQSSAQSQQSKGPMTLEDRRRDLAMASVAVGTPKAVAGKTASPAVSKPASSASTPQRQPALSSVNASQEGKAQDSPNSQAADAFKKNKFQKLLASKVDIDLGDF